MSNAYSQLSTGNTFGDWIVATNALVFENNNFNSVEYQLKSNPDSQISKNLYQFIKQRQNELQFKDKKMRYFQVFFKYSKSLNQITSISNSFNIFQYNSQVLLPHHPLGKLPAQGLCKVHLRGQLAAGGGVHRDPVQLGAAGREGRGLDGGGGRSEQLVRVGQLAAAQAGQVVPLPHTRVEGVLQQRPQIVVRVPLNHVRRGAEQVHEEDEEQRKDRTEHSLASRGGSLNRHGYSGGCMERGGRESAAPPANIIKKCRITSPYCRNNI